MTRISLDSKKRMVVLFACTVFYVLGLASFLIYHSNMLKIQIAENVNHRLRAVAMAVPLVLGEGFHDRVIASDSLAIDEEIEIGNKLRGLGDSFGVSYVYTLVENQGEFYLAASSAKGGNSDERQFYRAYPDIPAQLVQSYKNGVAAVATSKDQTGEFRTFCLPLTTPAGRKYLACADLSTTIMEMQTSDISSKAMIIFVFFLLLILPLVHLVFHYYLKLIKANDELCQNSDKLEQEISRRTLELEKARDDLLKNKEQLILALQTSKISIFKWNLKTEEINLTQNLIPGLDKMIGRKLSVRLFKRLLHNEDREEVMGKLARYVSGSADEFNVDCRIKANRQEYAWFHIIGKIVERSSTGIGLFMVGIVEDITELKARESALQQSQKLEAVGQLAGGIAHDFNNMLQAIIGYAEMIKLSMAEEDENFSIVDLLIEAAVKSQALVRQLLTFSRMSQETRENLDLNRNLTALIKMLKRLMGDRIRLEPEFSNSLPYVMANAGQLEQVIINLCVNARDAIDNDGEIRIKTEECRFDESFCNENPWARSGHFVKVSISDNGPGISLEHQKKIFEPFFTTKGVGKGTGLGLAIVYGVVQKHEGFINLISAPGQGCEFQIFLPASKVLDELKANTEAVSEEKLEGDETILLAEDAELVRNFAGRMLRKSGYNVIFACDGQEAVEQFERHSQEIDILVFDIVMPRMTGKVAFEQIQKIRSDLPVVFCSGYHEEILDTGFYSNFNGTFLPKPYKTNDLLRKIRSLLDKKKD